jgi:hypothetical protein
MNAEPVELKLHDFEKMSVKSLDERDHLKIAIVHLSPR